MRVLSIPSGHAYVRRICPDHVIMPDDPTTPWWPHPALEPDHIDAVAATIDLVHLHFGFEHRTEQQLVAWLERLRHHRLPLVFTAHDLTNPHCPDQRHHLRQLALLIEAADAVITLTPGAAAQIERDHRRRPDVIAHPPLLRAPRPHPDRRRVVTVPVKHRPNVMPVHEVVTILGPLLARHDLALEIIGSGPPMTDPELAAVLASSAMVFLPYRHGTHSGWIEACRSVGTPVIVPHVGHHGDQWDGVITMSVGWDDGAISTAVLDSAIALADQADHRALTTEQDDREVADARARHTTVYRRVVSPVLNVHTGDPSSGVHRYGRQIATLTHTPSRIVSSIAEAATLDLDDPTHRRETWHLQYSDHNDRTPAPDQWCVLGGRHDVDLVITLHDVPRSDEPHRFDRYREVCEAADAVVVLSAGERARLAHFSDAAATIIPHAIDTQTTTARGRSGVSDRRLGSGSELAILGHVYPGKGHETVIRASAMLERPLPVVALGGAAPGHDHLLVDLQQLADDVGVPFSWTGWISDDDIARRLHDAGLPVVANERPSASGSLASWLGVGRAPLVARSTYTEEVVERLRLRLPMFDDATQLAGLLSLDHRCTDRWLDRDDLVRIDELNAQIGAAYRSTFRLEARSSRSCPDRSGGPSPAEVDR